MSQRVEPISNVLPISDVTTVFGGQVIANSNDLTKFFPDHLCFEEQESEEENEPDDLAEYLDGNGKYRV